MELSDLWLKMAKNETLTPQELEFLRIQGKNTQQNNAQTAGQTNSEGKAQLVRPTIESPNWKGKILGSCIFQISKSGIASSADLSSGSSLDAVQYGKSDIFSVDPDSATRILVKTKNNFAFFGFLGWEANTTGTRRMGYNLMDKDNLGVGITFSARYPVTMSATSVGDAMGGFFILVDRTIEGAEEKTVEKVSFSGFQSSGSALTATGLVGFMEV
jgi:hypothetical protein